MLFYLCDSDAKLHQQYNHATCLKMNDGMRPSGLVCISTNTFFDVDIFIYKMFTFRSPDRGASSEHSYFFAKKVFCKKVTVLGAKRKHFVNKNIYIGERVC